MHRTHNDSPDISPYQLAFHRIRAEYVEMPGMRLTPPQVERLSGVNVTVCQAVLDDLVRVRFLRVGDDGRYVRYADEGPMRRSAKQDELRHAAP